MSWLLTNKFCLVCISYQTKLPFAKISNQFHGKAELTAGGGVGGGGGGCSCCCVDGGDRCSPSQVRLFRPGHFKDSHKCSFCQLCTLNCQHWLLCGLNRCISRLLGELHLKISKYKHLYFQPLCPQVSLQMKIHQNSGSGGKVTKHLDIKLFIMV